MSKFKQHNKTQSISEQTKRSTSCTSAHKKNDPLDKKNYRPVSILPTISKIYEIS